MDSMKSLNTSLPRSFPRRHPTADLHQAFKAAALSVAQLYKTAAADEDHARAAGYQDAIDELLAFLDQENLGVGDGEGWRIRQWATERISPGAYGSEDEVEEIRPARRSVSPNVQRRMGVNTVERRPTPTATPAQQVSTTTSTSREAPTEPQEIEATLIRPEIFQFRSTVLPADDTDMSNAERSTAVPANSSSNDRASAESSSSKTSRNHRHGLRGRASAIALANIGIGAGAKRKSPFSDILDLNSLDDKREGGGGGKRRHV